MPGILMLRVLLAMLLLFSCCTYANESFIHWYGGSVYPVPESEHIRMQSEHVTITLLKREYLVDARFVFVNEGDDAVITMGFPVESGGVLVEALKDDLVGDKYQIRDFRTWVEGQEVSFVRQSRHLRYGIGNDEFEISSDADIEKFKEDLKTQEKRLGKRSQNLVHSVYEKMWFCKEVRFPKGGTVTTRVQYVSQYGPSSTGYYWSAFYIYGSGRSWKGNIGHATFVINTSPSMRMVNYPDLKHPFNWTRNSEFSYTLEMDNFEPESDDDALDLDLSRSPDCYLGDYGGIDTTYPPTDENLSLCSHRQLMSFPKYVKRDIRRVGNPDQGTYRDKCVEYGRKYIPYVAAYLQEAEKRQFQYPIFINSKVVALVKQN